MKELKALEILRRELQNNYEKRPFVIKTELYHKERIEDFHEAIDELEALEIKDRLAELEKVILDYYLAKGYQIGVGGWAFNIKIRSWYKNKRLLVYFRQHSMDAGCIVFSTNKQETTKEMFDKAFEFFSFKV